jgi:putative PIN family toxin of toxin-antitoxin system
MRVFVDANTLVSGLIFKGNESRILEFGDIGVIELITSTEVFEEVGDVISRNEFDPEAKEIKNLLGYLQRTVQILGKPDDAALGMVSQLLDDKEDSHVWAGLMYADADFLLTGDKELLRRVDRAIRSRDLLKKLEDLMGGE